MAKIAREVVAKAGVDVETLVNKLVRAAAKAPRTYEMPLWIGALLTALLVMATLGFSRSGVRVLAYVVAIYLAIVGLAYLSAVLRADPAWIHTYATENGGKS